MWVRRLLFEKYLFIIKNDKTLSKKYYLLNSKSGKNTLFRVFT